MDRVLLLLAVAAVIAAVVVGVRAWTRRQARELAATPVDEVWRALGVAPDGRPAVVAFSTAVCPECRVQADQMAPLEGEGVRLLSIDAADRVDVAKAFHILTVPSTVVLADDGRVLAVNHGLAERSRLREQLAVPPVHGGPAALPSLPTR